MYNSRLGLQHDVHKLELALSNLDDLFDQPSADLVLELLDPA